MLKQGNFYDDFFVHSWVFFYKVVLTIILRCKSEILSAHDADGVISPIKQKCESGESIVKRISRMIWKEGSEWVRCLNESRKVIFDETTVRLMLSSYDIATHQFK